MWFEIKSNECFKMGPKLIFNYIKCVRENFSNSIKRVVFKVVQRNSYFAHPENIILTMLTDENQEVREHAVNTILAARISAKTGIRKFFKQKIDFKAKHYFEMSNIDHIEPPMTMNCSEEYLNECIISAENWVNKNISGIPVHTQAVERSIKLVSSVSSQTFGEENRNQLIYTTIASRSAIPKMNSKQDYLEYIRK